MHKIQGSILLALCLLWSGGVARSQSKNHELNAKFKTIPFSNLGSVAVIVEDFDACTKKIGISAAGLKSHAELKFRQSGIPVRVIAIDGYEMPTVYVKVNILHVTGTDQFVYGLSVELNQVVRLLRNERTLLAGTWQKTKMGITPANRAQQTISGTVDSLLESFMIDYLAVNAKR